MSSRKWHAIWIEQCEAARDIKARVCVPMPPSITWLLKNY